MSWDNVRGQQIPRLEVTVALLKQCLRLAETAPSETSAATRQELELLHSKAEMQLERLRSNRFEIAVLGLEKSGKSTLLNAWLGTELLPAAPERCTYTKTEIWGANSEADQLLQIEYYQPDEFERDVAEKRRARDGATGKDRESLDEELREIEQNKPEITRWLSRRVEEIRFKSVDEIRDVLHSAIAKDRSRARGAKKITLRTMSLKNDRDVVFFDVPGFNSPVTLHRQQAEEALRRVDVMLYAKEASKPDVEVSERNMLNVADQDKLVKTAEKTFVALTRIDGANTPEEFAEWVSKSRSKWPDLAPERIVPVCPVARLAALGTGSAETIKRGKKGLERLKEFGYGDGMEELKAAVERYIDTERATVLQRRCNEICSGALSRSAALIEEFSQKVPHNLEALDHQIEFAGNTLWGEWWPGEWRRIQAEFAKFYDEQIRGKSVIDGAGGLHPRLQELKKDFDKLVEVRFSNLPLLKDAELEAAYRRHVIGPGNADQPHLAHEQIRRELHPQAIQAINGIAVELAGALRDILRSMANKATELLWNIPDVGKTLLDESAPLARIEHGITTLFLRFARVAVNLLVSVPRVTRAGQVRKEQADVMMLAQFDNRVQPGAAEKIQPAVDPLLYVAERMQLILPSGGAAIDGAKGGAQGPARPRPGPFGPDPSQKPSDAFAAIKKELEGDIRALQDLLKTAVYDAAGFRSYCDQETDLLRQNFLNLENRRQCWQVAVKTEVSRKNPNVPYRLEDKQAEFRRQREIAEILDKVRSARSRLDSMRHTYAVS